MEAALGTHPGVATAVVVASGEGVERRLVAYWVPKPPAPPPAVSELRAHLADRLPGYLVPSVFRGAAGAAADAARESRPARAAGCRSAAG